MMMMIMITEAESTSVMLVNFYQAAWSYNAEDSHLDTCCCENLEYYMMILI
jgi:hypothetical protein